MVDTTFRASRRHVLAGFLGGSAFVLSGCKSTDLDYVQVASGAATVIQGLSMGEADELEMGRLYPRLIDSSGGAYANAAVQRGIRSFAEPLFRTSTRSAFQYEVVVLDDDTPNAWALPSGKVAVNKGLLRYVANEHELAAVLAHEIGHAEKSHALAEMRSKKFTEGLTVVGRSALDAQLGSAGGAWTQAALDAIQGPMLELVSSGYSRGNEAEADQHIMAVFKATGYDPRKASGMFRTLLQLIPEGASGSTSLFNSHPGTRERIAAIETAAAALPSPAKAPASPGFREIKRAFPTREFFRRNRAVS
jgi:predicted Zn-dependent protease